MAMVAASVRCPHCGRPAEETPQGLIEHHTYGCPLTPVAADSEPRQWVACPLCDGHIDISQHARSLTLTAEERGLLGHLTSQHRDFANRAVLDAAQAAA